MEIVFKDKHMFRAVQDKRLLLRTYGSFRAGILMRRLDDMRAAENMAELKLLPGHYHELTGDRKGQWACDLDHPYRLIMEPDGNNADFSKITVVDIIEITNYHGK